MKAPDLVGRGLKVEVKDRKSLPLWLIDARLQAHDYEDLERLEVLVITGPTITGDLVVLDLFTFRELLRKAGM